MPPQIRIAQVFAMTGREPSLSDPDQPWLTDTAERTLIVGYLMKGPAIMATSLLHEDRLDPSRGETVPLVYRTDGDWVWNEALVYYVREHGLAPESDLLAHIRSRGYDCPIPDDAACTAALKALFKK
jgi:hypothetical protein